MKAAIDPEGTINRVLAELMAHNTQDWIVIATLTQRAQQMEDERNIAIEAVKLMHEQLQSSGVMPIGASLEAIHKKAKELYERR